MISNKIIGSHIKAAREIARMTQEQVAEKVTMSAGHYGHIERGTRPASLELLDKLCHLLNVRLDDLLAGAVTDAHKIVVTQEPHNYTSQFDELARGCPDDLVETMLDVCRSICSYYHSHT